MDPAKTRHLDLGCGDRARNPYRREEVYGCDIVKLPIHPTSAPFTFVQADLSLGRLDFPDNTFDSVSAFDFIEHLPRQAVDAQGLRTSPFLDLMSDIHRVLKPGGLFLASTPAYPRAEAFHDPTHVNIITIRTHTYFCGPAPYGARYGFKGDFRAVKVKWEAQKNLLDIKGARWRKWWRDMEYRLFKGGLTHITWELSAHKP